MNNNKKLFFLSASAFLLSQFAVIYFYFFYTPGTVSVECTSSFTRNMMYDSQIFFSGELTLRLDRNGKGKLTISGKTSEDMPRYFQNAYLFSYHFDKAGYFIGGVNSSHQGVMSDIPQNDFKKLFMELDFRSRGGMKLYRFRNAYIFSLPGFIVNTCVPL